MAVAGRVAVVPKGDYDISVPYKRLDMVHYNKNSYVAKKDSTGVLPTDTDFWMLSMEGMGSLAEDIKFNNTVSGIQSDNVQGAIDEIAEGYIKKTDYATTESAGVVKPDGKTIKIGENGEIVGASSGFTGTQAELEQALANGEIEVGTIVNITDDFEEGGITVDSELSEASENPVQNKVLTGALKEKIGNEKIANSSVVTETGFVADARQLNQEVGGSYAAGVAGQISGINQGLANINKNHLTITSNGEQTKYRGFGALPTNGNETQLIALVSGVGGFGHPAPGVYLVACSTRGQINMIVTELSPPFYESEVKFGYWVSGGTVFFGMMQGYYNYDANILALNTRCSFGEADISLCYDSTVKPDGWTEVGKRIFATV